MPFGFLASFVVLTVVVFFFKSIFLSNDPRSRSLPSPPRWPLLGHLPLLGNLPHVTLFKLSKTYGSIMFIKFGLRDMLVVSSPTAAKEVLHVNDRIFSSRPIPAMAKLLRAESGLGFSPHGEHWKLMRRIATTELFTSRSLESMVDVRKGEVKEMIVSIFNDSKMNLPTLIGSKAFATTIGIVEKMVCGRKVLRNIDELKEMVWRVLQLAGRPTISDIFPFMEKLDLLVLNWKAKKEAKRFEAFVDMLIEDHAKEMGCGGLREGRKHFLHVLMEISRDNPEFKKEDVKAMLVDMFIGGTDSSSTTTEWAMTELLRHPQAMKKAQTELDAVVGHARLMNESDIHNLPYLQAIVKEVLRLHPATPLYIPRRADEDCEVQGFHVRKGTQVLVNLWGISRDENVWERALSFEPERFESSNMDYKTQEFEFFPFGAGRRICVGMPLAIRAVHLMVGSMIHCFDWQTIAEIDLEEVFGVTLHKLNPLQANATPRLSPKLYEY